MSGYSAAQQPMVEYADQIGWQRRERKQQTRARGRGDASEEGCATLGIKPAGDIS